MHIQLSTSITPRSLAFPPTTQQHHPPDLRRSWCSPTYFQAEFSSDYVPFHLWIYVEDAGTEDGVTEPQATFSSCFAQPFLALHPMRYAKMLAEKIEHHKANAWLLNTGWVGAGATTGGKRCPLKYTRAILDAIHSGELAKVEYETYATFNLAVPKSCPGVPNELLNPEMAWSQGPESFKTEVKKLGGLFVENFKKYSSEATEEVIKAGPAV